MPNGGDATPQQFRKWERAFAPYEKAIEKFVREKNIRVEKWYHDIPTWHIGRNQGIEDLNVIWWSIQLNYDENQEKFTLYAMAWIDKEYRTSEGLVKERRLTYPEKALVATWKVGKKISMKKLLEKAYQKATSYSEQDLTWVSVSIQGKDDVWRNYTPAT